MTLFPGGFAKSWRKELHSDVWLMPPIYHRVWYWLRLNVQHTTYLFPTQGRFGIWVLPGQRITSLRQIAEGVAWKEWGVEKVPNTKTVKAVLGWLEGQEMVTVESNAKGTLVSIVNWHSYNDIPDEKVTDESNSERITDGTRSGHKEECNRKINKKPSPAKKPPADSRIFSDWFCYAFELCQGYRYTFEGGKDGKALAEMLSEWPWKGLVAKACHFLTDEDRFPKNKAPTLTFLKSKVNDYPDHIDGKADHFRDIGLIPPDGVLLEDWTPWQQ